MTRYWRSYSQLSRVVTAICVAAGLGLDWYFDLRQPYSLLVAISAVVIALFLGHYFPEMALSLLLKLRSFRRQLFGKTWVEGYWLTKTVFGDGTARPGIVRMEYAHDDFSRLDIVGWQRTDEIISAHSTYATVDDDLHLINYFTTTEARPRVGVAVGKLVCTYGPFPNEYHGKRFYFADETGTEVYQRAIKLSPEQVSNWKKRFGERWIDALLFEASDNLLRFFSPGAPQSLALESPR
jgi:hypothetical protein